jgi:hypothetical protein
VGGHDNQVNSQVVSSIKHPARHVTTLEVDLGLNAVLVRRESSLLERAPRLSLPIALDPLINLT